MKKLHVLCVALIAACWCGVAAAQTVPMRTVPVQPQAAQPDTDPNSLAQWALQVLGMIDSQQTGVLWDGASPVAKQAVRRDEFVAKVSQTRKALGTPVNHVWMSVRRQLATQGIPPGLYATMEFASTFQNNKSVIEVISLRRDEDGRWRFAGYFTR